MSGETDLIKLYSARILALAADIPNLDRLENPDVTVKKRSPLCGSTVTVDVRMQDGKVAEFGQDVKACALGQASASVVEPSRKSLALSLIMTGKSLPTAKRTAR